MCAGDGVADQNRISDYIAGGRCSTIKRLFEKIHHIAMNSF